MQKKMQIICALVLVVGIASCRGQLLDQLMNMRTSGNSGNSIETGNDQTAQSVLGSTLKRLMGSMQNVNIPAFYEMNKDGSSMGINVLSGLVKVERGNEAERSGLTGPRPLSVRVFGVPVYERGKRVRQPSSSGSEPLLPGLTASGKDNKNTDDEEELPIES